MNKQTLYKAEREQAEVRRLLRQSEDAEDQAWCKRYREVQTIKTDMRRRMFFVTTILLCFVSYCLLATVAVWYYDQMIGPPVSIVLGMLASVIGMLAVIAGGWASMVAVSQDESEKKAWRRWQIALWGNVADDEVQGDRT